MTKTTKFLLIIGAVLLSSVVVIIFLRGNEDTWIKDKNGNWIMHGQPLVVDFESCSQKYPIEESFPRKCSIPKGPTFTEEIERIAVYGDSRDGHDIHRKIVAEIVQYSPKYVFHTGDLVDDGSIKEQWDTFNSITEQISSTIFPVLGNHEKNDPNYYNNFVLPGNEEWYYMDTEFVYFICIDSNKILEADPGQLNWFKEQLAIANNNNKFVAIVMHHPLFSSAKHATDDISIKLKETLVPLIEGKANVVFAGHDHVYERLEKDGVSYLTIGSAGAPLYQLANKSPHSILFESKYSYAQIQSTKEKMSLKIIDENGEEFDSLEIKK
ncbi:MAG: metallophosphoesterase [Patescibacteria group bacterium]